MYGIIYTYTNTLNGLIYVGQTINPQSRQQQYARDVASTSPNPRSIIQAMQQSGLEAFAYQILAEASTKDELNRLEIHYIARLQANNPLHGYNRTEGGEGWTAGQTRSPETRAKMSLAKRGRIFSDEHRAKIGLAGRGRTVSPETRAKISLSQRGNRNRAGRTHSDETKAKISLLQRGRCLPK